MTGDIDREATRKKTPPKKPGDAEATIQIPKVVKNPENPRLCE